MNYTIRQIKLSEYPEVRLLDRDSFGKNERGSNADEHEIFADNIRKFGIIKDDSVEDPDWCLFAVELIENGFQDTNK